MNQACSIHTYQDLRMQTPFSDSGGDSSSNPRFVERDIDQADRLATTDGRRGHTYPREGVTGESRQQIYTMYLIDVTLHIVMNMLTNTYMRRRYYDGVVGGGRNRTEIKGKRGHLGGFINI